MSAEVGKRVDRRPTRRLDVEGGTRLEVGDEVDGLLALFRVRERRHPEIELSCGQAGDDAVEARVHELDLDSHDGAKSLAKIRVHLERQPDYGRTFEL